MVVTVAEVTGTELAVALPVPFMIGVMVGMTAEVVASAEVVAGAVLDSEVLMLEEVATLVEEVLLMDEVEELETWPQEPLAAWILLTAQEAASLVT